MKILVLNGSPSGKDSITLYTALYIMRNYPEHDYEILHVGQQIRKMEKDKSLWEDKLKSSDLILFCYPVYTFLVPAQLHRFIEIVKESGIDISGKYASQISTSKHFYDITAHRFIQENCADLGMKYVSGLSADMEDLLHEEGRRQALSFFDYLLWNISRGYHEPSFVQTSHADLKTASDDVSALNVPAPKRAVIIADFTNSTEDRLQAMCRRLKKRLPCETEIIDIGAFQFAGGCLGCFSCASNGKCVYGDGFDSYLRENIQTADAMIYAYAIKDHSMGYRFKLFDDRQFCNGHRTVTMGKPIGYIIDGSLDAEPDMRTLMEARVQVGGNMFAGTACDQSDPDREIDQLAERICYDVTECFDQPKNFYGVGGMKIFRDLIWQMQGLMRADHKFYKKHGFYDFPQKKRGSMMAMYLVGAMMRSPKLRKKLGGRMTEIIIMPYKKIIDSVPKEKKK